MAKAASTGGTGDGRQAKGRAPRGGSPLPPPGGQRTSTRKFIRESWGELRKVQWPTRQQVAQGTLVVGVVTAFFAAYISITDQVMVFVVREINQLIR